MPQKLMATVYGMIILLAFWAQPALAAESKVITLAVSPFKNLMRKADLNWMEEGFAETLTTKLNHIRRLRLVERVQFNEIMDEKKLSMAGLTESKASDVGNLLSADFLLLGSFQKLDIGDNATLKINARLVNIKTGAVEQGSAVSAQGAYASVFEIQEKLAADISKKLGIGISDAELQRMGIDETTSVTAYEFYHQAKNETDPARRELSLKTALKHDPDYAKAHLLLGSFYSVKAATDASLEPQALKHLKTALRLDAGLDDAHSALGDYYYRKSRALRQHMDAKEDEAISKALFHLNTFIRNKQASKAKYYIWKVKKARKKVKRLSS